MGVVLIFFSFYCLSFKVSPQTTFSLNEPKNEKVFINNGLEGIFLHNNYLL